MLDIALGLIKDQFSTPAVACLLIATAAALTVRSRWSDALKTAGRDGKRLIESLRLGGDLRQYYVFLIERALNRADMLLKDAGQARLSIRSPFGNRRAAPFWS